MIIEQSIRVTCDRCSVSDRLVDGQPVRVTDHRGVVPTTMNFQYGRIVAEAVNVMVTSGWVLTSARNADGKHVVYVDAASLPRSMHRARHYLVCASCAPDWTPPFSKAAARELERIRLSSAIDADELGLLRAEVERLRTALANVRSTAEAVA